jgi:uncharacterized RmlC-like cupin family protein
MEKKLKPTCKIVSATESYHGKQGFDYQSAISRESVGAEHICMHLVNVPPGGRAKAHLHQNHETTVYMLSGEGAMWYGERLEEHLVMKPGDFLYIPAGMPHLAYNPSKTVPMLAVLARTDPNEQESVVLLPELENIHAID